MASNRTRPPKCHTVGAIVKNSKGDYLVVYRKKKPKGLAFPAGHIKIGEDPEDALVRELMEETGLRARGFRRKLRTAILGCCSRGAKKHLWYVYSVTAPGRPKWKEKKNHAFVKFMSPKKIREYVELDDADPSFVEIWKQLNIIIRQKHAHRKRR